MKRFGHENGQTLLFAAISLSVLLGFAAMATDVGSLYHQRRIAQAAADSAAIAGATAALGVQNGSSAEAVATTAGQLDASSYGFSSSDVTINTPPTDDFNSTFNKPGYVEAIVTEKVPTPLIAAFIHLVNPNSTYTGMGIRVRAVATDTITSNGCVQVNNPTGYNPGADLGGDSLLLAQNCGVTVNGDLTMQGASTITAGSLGVSGSINFVGNGSSVPTETVQNTAPASDPLSALSQPQNAPTAGTTPNGACATTPSGTGNCYYDWQNGNLSGNLQPGVYFFDEDVTISGTLTNLTASGANNAGVTIFMSGSHIFSFKNNGTINLTPPGWNTTTSAPTCPVGGSNPYCGVLVDAPTDVASDNTCKHGSNPNIIAGTIQLDFGSSVTAFDGVVYAPQAHVFLQDQGATATINSDLDIGTLCQQSANVTVDSQSLNTPITRIGLVE